MFRDLSTSTKLALLCGSFIIAIAVAIFGLVLEKTIAIEFARKELVGNHYLDALRETYSAILDKTDASDGSAATRSIDEAVTRLAAVEAEVKPKLHTGELNETLVRALRTLQSEPASGAGNDNRFLAALSATQDLARRIGEDSNLTLDPDLDTYYLQDIIVRELPKILGYVGEARTLAATPIDSAESIDERRANLLALNSLLLSSLNAVSTDLQSATRLDPGGRLTTELGPKIEHMVVRIRDYLIAIGADPVHGEVQVVAAKDARAYDNALGSTLVVWTSTAGELNRLLTARISNLLGRLWSSLLIAGAFAALSIVIALMTHRDIVRPLKRLESVTRTVQETGDYSLRTEDHGRDEIGTLSHAFNDMMKELDAAREREAADQARAAATQAELARISRLTTMGEMAASIAHEINQPLAAIVASGNAGLRWLNNATPDLDEAREALKRIVSDGHRAGQVMKSVRSLFKDQDTKVRLDANALILEVVSFTHRDLLKNGIELQTSFAKGLPAIMADPVQLQQVLLNLINNAMEAMAPIDDRRRTLHIESVYQDTDRVAIRVSDSGTGIDPQHKDRIFEAFFTTKSSGMGMGLSICRSIIQAHGGQLLAAASLPCGSTFSIILPRIAGET